MDKIEYYLGRFGEEQFLFADLKPYSYPNNGDFIFFKDEIYKVMYSLYDYDNGALNVFVRMAVSEDF